MKLLFISPYLPHPRCGHGAGVFIYELLIRLARRHTITLISFCDSYEATLAKDYEQLPIKLHTLARAKGAKGDVFSNLKLLLLRMFQLLGSVLRWEPYYVSKYRSRDMRNLIERITKDEAFDIVQIEFTQMAQYVNDVRSGKTFLQELDVSYKPAYRRYKKSPFGFRKIVAFIEWCRWARYEPKAARLFDQVLTVTDQDRLLLSWLSRSGNISYFPHAVEIPDTIPGYIARKPRSLVFVGTYSHQPNVDAAVWLIKDIFPLIAKRFPDAELSIIGPHPTNEMKEYAALTQNIHVLGFVDDVNVYLRQSAIFITPLRFGGGVKNKVLFAMAQGIPVVSTPVGIEGIDGVNSTNVVLGDSVENLVRAVSLLFEDPSKAAAIGLNGREIVRQWYSWEYVISRLENIYSNILTGKSVTH